MKIEFLDHILTHGQLSVSSKTVDAIKTADSPTDSPQVRYFFGPFILYRRLIKLFFKLFGYSRTISGTEKAGMVTPYGSGFRYF